jgi:uncharacterized membrane protein
MKTFTEFVKAALAGGLLVILPLFGCVLLLVRLIGSLLDLIKPFLDFLPKRSFAGLAIRDLAAAGVLLLLCFLIGLFVGTSVGQSIGRWIESRILHLVPGYSFFRRLSLVVSGREETSGVPVVVRLADSWQIGFLVEEHRGGEMTVFIPEAPTLLTGDVVIVNSKCVKKLCVHKSQVARSIASFGLGMSALLSGQELPEGEEGMRRNEVTDPHDLDLKPAGPDVLSRNKTA